MAGLEDGCLTWQSLLLFHPVPGLYRCRASFAGLRRIKKARLRSPPFRTVEITPRRSPSRRASGCRLDAAHSYWPLYFGGFAKNSARHFIRLSNSASCSAMRCDMRSSSAAPEYAAACSTSSPRFSRAAAMRSSISRDICWIAQAWMIPFHYALPQMPHGYFPRTWSASRR